MVGTLASDNAKHAMILWRSSDIYVVRMANESAWGWSGETSQACSKTRDAATLALVYKEFENRKALEDYAVHPLHQEAKKQFHHFINTRVAADYEV